MPLKHATPFHSFLRFLQLNHDLFLLCFWVFVHIPKRFIAVDDPSSFVSKIGRVAFNPNREKVRFELNVEDRVNLYVFWEGWSLDIHQDRIKRFLPFVDDSPFMQKLFSVLTAFKHFSYISLIYDSSNQNQNIFFYQSV